MPAATDRLEFAPPQQPGTVTAFVLAVLAHLLLMAALTWGINWNRESEDMMAEAELWSSVPRPAAPAAPVVQAPVVVPAPPPPPPPPAPVVKAEPPPVPTPKPPDITTELEKRKQQQAQREQEELERQKKLEARKKKEEQQKREVAEKKAAEEKKRQEEAKAKAAREQEEAKQRDAMRKENMARIMKGAEGVDERASGPSDSYAGRIQARVRPHIVFTEDISGNPKAEVEVRLAPDGTIVSRRLTKSSGVNAWDEAVLRALDKTEVLPKDIDGRVHTPLTIQFRPRS